VVGRKCAGKNRSGEQKSIVQSLAVNQPQLCESASSCNQQSRKTPDDQAQSSDDRPGRFTRLTEEALTTVVPPEHFTIKNFRSSDGETGNFNVNATRLASMRTR
jgi:hypothetical protein